MTTCWADERVYYPLHAVPYPPTHHCPKGRNDPAFRRKLQIGATLAWEAKEAGVSLRAVAAHCANGDQDGFRYRLSAAGLQFVMALKPHRGSWSYDYAYRPVDAVRGLALHSSDHPGDWRAVTRAFRDRAHHRLAIRHHQTLVTCSFSFCWDTWFTPAPPCPRGGTGSRPNREGALPCPTSPHPACWPQTLGAERGWLTP